MTLTWHFWSFYCWLESSSCNTCLKIDEDDLVTLNVGNEAAEVWATILDDNKTGLFASLLWFDCSFVAAKLGFITPNVGMAEVGVDLPELCNNDTNWPDWLWKKYV